MVCSLSLFLSFPPSFFLLFLFFFFLFILCFFFFFGKVDLFDINGSFINNFWDIVDRHRPERNKYNTKKTNYEMLEGGKGEEGRRERLPGRGEEERGWEGRGGGLVEERKGKKWLSKRDQKILDEGLKWQAWKHTIVVVGNKKDIMPIKGKWEEEKVRVWLKHYCEGMWREGERVKKDKWRYSRRECTGEWGIEYFFSFFSFF